MVLAPNEFMDMRPVPELDRHEKIAAKIQAMREELKTLTGNEYDVKLEKWGRSLLNLAEIQPIDDRRGGLFELDLPGDYQALNRALIAVDEWLKRAVHSGSVSSMRLQAFMSASGEFLNDELEHSLGLGDPDLRRRKPEKSVWLGVVLTYDDGEPTAELILETTGTMPPRDILEKYFEIEETTKGGEEGTAQLELTPRPLEDFVPDLSDLDEGSLDQLSEGGRGYLMIAGQIEGTVNITYPADTHYPANEDEARRISVPHTTKLTEVLAAA